MNALTKDSTEAAMGINVTTEMSPARAILRKLRLCFHRAYGNIHDSRDSSNLRYLFLPEPANLVGIERFPRIELDEPDALENLFIMSMRSIMGNNLLI